MGCPSVTQGATFCVVLGRHLFLIFLKICLTSKKGVAMIELIEYTTLLSREAEGLAL